MNVLYKSKMIGFGFLVTHFFMIVCTNDY